MMRPTVGIDDIAVYIPKLYLPIETLAKVRNIEYAKLNKGLGLTNMAIPDVHEDAATMAANAVRDIIDRNGLDPKTIGRLYLGTESALDGAKPTATYVLEMLRQYYSERYGTDCLLHCDVVDLTFACVGGVDALHNTLDWVRGDQDRIGIVVCSDFAKYELASTGEYTQGAGAVALLIKQQPRLLTIADNVGVATMSEHDFFKPQHKVSKLQIIDEVLELIGRNGLRAEELLQRLPQTLEVKGVLDDNDDILTLHKDTPVFDGPFSNRTYQNRIREAYLNFRNKGIAKGTLNQDEILTNRWNRLVFHLPYAYHAKRVFSEIYKMEMEEAGTWPGLAETLGLVEPVPQDYENPVEYEAAYGKMLRAVTKSEQYRSFVHDKLEKGQRASREVGNMYACSIFLALMSILEADWREDSPLAGKKLGFFGYGSGSKSKVFEAEVQEGWREVVKKFRLQQQLEARTEIDYPTYEKLHRLRQNSSVLPPAREFILREVGSEGVNQGARYYSWVGDHGDLIRAAPRDRQDNLAL